VRGWVHFDDADRQAEARRFLELRYRLSALVADEYAPRRRASTFLGATGSRRRCAMRCIR
jgi:hypothetical protein